MRPLACLQQRVSVGLEAVLGLGSRAAAQAPGRSLQALIDSKKSSLQCTALSLEALRSRLMHCVDLAYSKEEDWLQIDQLRSPNTLLRRSRASCVLAEQRTRPDGDGDWQQLCPAICVATYPNGRDDDLQQLVSEQ
eukprot:6179835-Pleurochrysis_carterae.AAC.8